MSRNSEEISVLLESLRNLSGKDSISADAIITFDYIAEGVVAKYKIDLKQLSLTNTRDEGIGDTCEDVSDILGIIMSLPEENIRNISIQDQAQTAEVQQIQERNPVKLARYLLWQAMLSKTTLDENQRVILRNRLIELIGTNQEGLQEDASEKFITPLLEIIFQENHPLQISKTITSPDAAQRFSTKTDGLNKIELPIKKIGEVVSGEPKTASVLFTSEQAVEKLEGANKYKYEKPDGTCELIDAEIHHKYISNQDEIIITLKRFDLDENFETAKLNNPVNLDNIEIKKSADSQETQTYEATAFIVHMGGIQGGHYTAFIKDDAGSWWCYNDNRVIQIADDEIELYKAQAYIVKYSKAGVGLSLPNHQEFGTTNFDGLNNACWANASLAFILSCDSIKTKLEAEFATQNYNPDQEIAELDLRVDLKMQQRLLVEQYQLEQQRLALIQQQLLMTNQELVRPERFKTAEELELTQLEFSLHNIKELYKEGENELLRLRDKKGEETTFRNFQDFSDDLKSQLDIELDGYNPYVYGANESLINIAFPTEQNPELFDLLSELGKSKTAKYKFFDLLNNLLGFYGLIITQNDDTDEMCIEYMDEDDSDIEAEWKKNSTTHTRFEKAILSAIYFGYDDYAQILYDFIRSEIDLSNPTLIVNDTYRDFLHKNIPDLFYQRFQKELQRVRSSQEVITESPSKRKKIEDEEKQDSKIITTINSKAVLDYPDIKLPIEDQELTIGDLHGNALKLLWILSYHDLIEISEQDYNDFVSIYLEPQESLAERDFQEFNEIISRIKVKDKNVLLRLIGDCFCDRGQNDYFTALLLGHLHDQGLETEILFSNHDADFVNCINNYQAATKKTAKEFALHLGHTLDYAGNSMDNLKYSLANGTINETNFQNFYKIIEEKYLPKLKLISYNLKPDGSIVIFTHAPCGLKAIESAAKKFSLEYKAASAEELAQTIDAINQEFSKYIKGEKKRADGSIITISQFELNQIETVKNDEEAEAEEHAAYIAAAKTDFQTFEELDKAIEKYPITFLTWSRIFKTNHIFDENSQYQIKYTFGHDQGGSVMPRGVISEEQKTYYKKRIENLCNLDNEFCKGDVPGYYTYRFDERQKKKEKPSQTAHNPQANTTKTVIEII